MDTDLELTLALLAVRMLGGRAEAAHPALKTLRKSVAAAVAANLLAQETETVVNPPGTKPAKRKVKVLRLTEEGERHLAIGDPAALAATQAAHLAAVRAGIEADRDALRAELRGVLANLTPDRSEKVAQALERVAARLGDVTKLLGTHEPEVSARVEEEVLVRVERGFQALLDRLGPPAPAPVPTLAAPMVEVGASEPAPLERAG